MSSIEPSKDSETNSAPVEESILNDMTQNNNVYDKVKEDNEDVNKVEEDQHKSEESEESLSHEIGGNSGDDTSEDHEQHNPQALAVSSSTQSDESSGTPSNVEKEETDSSTQGAVLDEGDKECASDDDQCITAANETLSESNGNGGMIDNNTKLVSECDDPRLPISTAEDDKNSENQSESSVSSEQEKDEHSCRGENAEKPETSDDKQSSISADGSSPEDAVLSPVPVADLGEKEGGSKEVSRAKKVAADRDRKNPAYIPRSGKFFMHDEREGNNMTLEQFESSWFEKKRQEQEQMERKKGGRIRYGFNGDRWANDKFDERLQAPKSNKEIVSEYGYNIREDGQANRKKYWDGSYKYDDNKEDGREGKRWPRRNGNEGGARGLRPGGRRRPNYGGNNRSGPGFTPDGRGGRNGQYHSSEQESAGYTEESTPPVNRDPAANNNCSDGRGKRPRTFGPKHRREFKGKLERPVQNSRRCRNGQEQEASEDRRLNVVASSDVNPHHNSQSTRSDNSLQSYTSPPFSNSTFPKTLVHVETKTSPTSVELSDSSSKISAPKVPEVTTKEAAIKPIASKIEETKGVSPAYATPDAAPNNGSKAPQTIGYPSNKRYSAQCSTRGNDQRKFDREVVPSRRQYAQQRQVPSMNPVSQIRPHDSHSQQKHLQEQRPSQLTQPAPESQHGQQPPPLSMSQLQQSLPPMNYQAMHGGLEYAPHAQLIPSIPQQDLIYYSSPPQYLLNYFHAITVDPNLQLYTQEQMAAAPVLANGQFSGGAAPSGPEAHYQAVDNGGTVFYLPLAQQQPPQLTSERPRRALPIVAPSAGTDS